MFILFIKSCNGFMDNKEMKEEAIKDALSLTEYIDKEVEPVKEMLSSWGCGLQKIHDEIKNGPIDQIIMHSNRSGLASIIDEALEGVFIKDRDRAFLLMYLLAVSNHPQFTGIFEKKKIVDSVMKDGKEDLVYVSSIVDSSGMLNSFFLDEKIKKLGEESIAEIGYEYSTEELRTDKEFKKLDVSTKLVDRFLEKIGQIPKRDMKKYKLLSILKIFSEDYVKDAPEDSVVEMRFLVNHLKKVLKKEIKAIDEEVLEERRERVEAIKLAREAEEDRKEALKISQDLERIKKEIEEKAIKESKREEILSGKYNLLYKKVSIKKDVSPDDKSVAINVEKEDTLFDLIDNSSSSSNIGSKFITVSLGGIQLQRAKKKKFLKIGRSLIPYNSQIKLTIMDIDNNEKSITFSVRQEGNKYRISTKLIKEFEGLEDL